MYVSMVSLTIGRLILRLWVYRYDRLWHADNGSVNDRQVDIAVMGITLRSVIACSILVWRLSTNLVMVSLTIGRLTLRLWVYRYDRLWHAVPWSDSFQ